MAVQLADALSLCPVPLYVAESDAGKQNNKSDNTMLLTVTAIVRILAL